jgi:hypothetical protein
MRSAASASVETAGAFHATMTPRASTTFRAVSGADASPSLRVLVLDRRVAASAHAHGRRVVLNTRIRPASRVATVTRCSFACASASAGGRCDALDSTPSPPRASACGRGIRSARASCSSRPTAPRH